MRTWQPHTQRLSALVFSPDGQLLATTAGQSKLVWLWDATTGALVRKLHGNEFPGRAVAFTPDGKHLAGMQAGLNINIWEIETGRLVSVCGFDYGGPKSLAFEPNGTGLVAAGSDVYCWTDPLDTSPVSVRPRYAVIETPKAVERVGFSPTGRLVYACGGRLSISSANPDELPLGLENPGGNAAINGFAFPRDESRVAVAYQSTTAAVFDLTDPSARSVLLRGHKAQQVRAIGFTPDGRTVVTVGNDGTSRFWDPATGVPLRVFDWGLGVLSEAAFAPDGLTCAAGSAKGKVVVWDLDI